jgi:predicted enzyme related to lactoylglutathione lyase
MNPVVHFELPYSDRGRATRFYETVFGWKAEALGEAMGNYVLVTTAESDARTDAPAGAINGGMFPKEPGKEHPSIVIGVADIARAIELVRDAGGEVLDEPYPIPGIGLYVAFVDTEGNRSSMLQPLRA